MKLILATSNSHKTQEVATILGENWEVLDLKAHTDIVLPEETGSTFEENAVIKAMGASRHLPDSLILADDSGLEVDVLKGEPGVKSARYAGEEATDEDNRRLLKDRLRRVSRNPGQVFSARFRCCLALVKNGRVLNVSHGTVEGYISIIERGRGGFGYDSMFIPEGHKKSFGELPAEIKNQLSHRAKAIDTLQNWLKSQPAEL